MKMNNKIKFTNNQSIVLLFTTFMADYIFLSKLTDKLWSYYIIEKLIALHCHNMMDKLQSLLNKLTRASVAAASHVETVVDADAHTLCACTEPVKLPSR